MPTAEEANAINAAWNAAQAAGIPYTPPKSAAQDAADEYAKHQAAFSQPRNDLDFAHSSNYDAIVAQYNAQKYYSVGSSGLTYQPTGGPKIPTIENPQNAAQIAYNVAVGGGNLGREVIEKSQAWGFDPTPYVNRPVQQQVATRQDIPQYDRVGNPLNSMAAQEQAYRNALNPYGRAGYTGPDTLGDINTQRMMSATERVRPALAGLGYTLPSPTAMEGTILSAQLDRAIGTEGTRDDQFFNTELQKWGQNFVERSSEYHHTAMRSGVPVPANPFEYQGDLAVEFLKGSPNPLKSSEWFSPVSGEMGANLPGGRGLQQVAWETAKTGAPGFSFADAVRYINSKEGQYGPYGKLWGGPDYEETVHNAPQFVGATPAGNMVVTPQRWLSSGPEVTENAAIASGIPLPFISTARGVPSETLKSEFYIKDIPVAAYIVAGAFLPPLALAPFVTGASGVSGNIPSAKISAESEPGRFASYASGMYYVGQDAFTTMLPGSPSLTPETLTITKTGTPKITGTIEIFPEKTTISGGNETITRLGNWIDTNRQFVSTPEQAAEFNRNVELYNKMGAENPIITTTTGGMTLTKTGETPVKTYKYGQFDVYSERLGEIVRGGLGAVHPFTSEQFKAYGPEVRERGSASENILYGAAEFAIERPLYVLPYAGAGALMYLGGEAVTGTLGLAAEGTGLLAGTARVLTTPGTGGVVGTAARTVATYGLPVYLGAKGAWDITEGGAEIGTGKMWQNVGASVIPAGAMAVGFVTPNVAPRTFEYATERFAVKPSVVEEYRLVETSRTGLSETSVTGQEVSLGYTVTRTVSRQPTFLGFEFPRIFSPREVSRATTDLGANVDAAHIINRMSNVEGWEGIVPEHGTRVTTLRLETYAREPTVRGTGGVSFTRSALSRSLDEYLGMGRQESASLGGSAFEHAQSILDLAWETETPTVQTGTRTLSVSVEPGTPILEAFDWNTISLQTHGGTFDLMRMDLDTYITGLAKNVESEPIYGPSRTMIAREASGSAIMSEEGLFTSTVSPEAKIIQHLQAVGRNIPVNAVEEAFGYDIMGRPVARTSGVGGSVSLTPEIEASPFRAHTHPYYTFGEMVRMVTGMSFGELPMRAKINVVRQALPYYLHEWFGPESASAGDFATYGLSNTRTTLGEYIASPKGVVEFKPTDSWGYYYDIARDVVGGRVTADTAHDPIPGDVNYEAYGLRPPRQYGLTERVTGEPFSIQVSDVTAQIRAELPADIRSQAINALDRIAFGDATLEFIREPARSTMNVPPEEIPFGGRYMSPSFGGMQIAKGAVEAERRGVSAAPSRDVAAISERISTTRPSISRALPPRMVQTGRVRVTPIAASGLVPGVISETQRQQARERVQIISPQITTIPSQPTLTRAGQRSFIDTSLISGISSDVSRISGFERTSLISPALTTSVATEKVSERAGARVSIPSMDLIGIRESSIVTGTRLFTGFYQETEQVQTREHTSRETTKTEVRETETPSPPFSWGYLPSSGGGGGGHRPRRRRKTELFSFEMGIDTPIPARYGLGGRTLEFVPGHRGIARDILKPSEYAPNPLSDILGTYRGNRL